MQEYVRYNLHRYLCMDKKKYIFIWIGPFLLFLLLIIVFFKLEAYQVIEIKGQTFCQQECTIQFFYPAEEFQYEFIKINNQIYDIDKVIFSESMLDANNMAIQTITLQIPNYRGNHNEFVTVKIYKNKEKLLKKIIKIIKEK